jgi:hypothetical protein
LLNFRPKNNILIDNLERIFLFDIYHFNLGLAFKNKNYYITLQNCVYLIKFPKLKSKMQVSFVKEAPGNPPGKKASAILNIKCA